MQPEGVVPNKGVGVCLCQCEVTELRRHESQVSHDRSVQQRGQAFP